MVHQQTPTSNSKTPKRQRQMTFSKRNRIYIHNALRTSCNKLLDHRQAQEFNIAGASGLSTPSTESEAVSVDSKERLTEIATSIRGISSALAQVSLSLRITSVVVVTKLSDEALPHKARELVEWFLMKRPEITVAVQDVFKDRKQFDYSGIKERYPSQTHRLKFWNTETVTLEPDRYDMVITLGGDGTVLFTSWMFQQIVPPVLSFGLGSLGFMTDNDFKHFKSTISNYLDNGIQCSLRMRFAAVHLCTKSRYHISGDPKGSTDLRQEIAAAATNLLKMDTHVAGEEFVVLNDIVVDRGPNPNVTMTELYGNFDFITNISADGVVLSTPTGSTAYSMSAGGSLVHPEIGATLISPICPHSLSFRPLVLPDSMVVAVGVPYDARASAYASFDGRERIEIKRGDFLVVAASRFPFPKIIDSNYTSATWVKELGENLHWNEGRRLKPFN